MTMILMSDDYLTDDQRTWQPGDSDEALTQWPTVRKVDVWEGQLLYWAVVGARWDWRSVSMAARTFPHSRIELRQPEVLAVIFGSPTSAPGHVRR